MTQHHYIECACDSAEHVVRLSANPTDEYLPLWFEFHLVHHRRWWTRVWVAVKYIFGYQSKYGAFDTCCPSGEAANEIVRVIRTVYKYDGIR